MGFFKKIKRFVKKQAPRVWGAATGAAAAGVATFGNPFAIAAGGFAGIEASRQIEKLFEAPPTAPQTTSEPTSPGPEPASPFGIPLPGKTGSELGQDASDFFDKAFPGTNPWERLGTGNPAGSVESSQISAKQQQRALQGQEIMQRRELGTRMQIAQMNAEASRKNSRTSAMANLASTGIGALTRMSINSKNFRGIEAGAALKDITRLGQLNELELQDTRMPGELATERFRSDLTVGSAKAARENIQALKDRAAGVKLNRPKMSIELESAETYNKRRPLTGPMFKP